MYTLVVERLERHVLVERQVAAVMRAAGSKHGEVPTFEGHKGKLDALLGDKPRRHYAPEQADLIAAVGLGR